MAKELCFQNCKIWLVPLKSSFIILPKATVEGKICYVKVLENKFNFSR